MTLQTTNAAIHLFFNTLDPVLRHTISTCSNVQILNCGCCKLATRARTWAFKGITHALSLLAWLAACRLQSPYLLPTFDTAQSWFRVHFYGLRLLMTVPYKNSINAGFRSETRRSRAFAYKERLTKSKIKERSLSEWKRGKNKATRVRSPDSRHWQEKWCHQRNFRTEKRSKSKKSSRHANKDLPFFNFTITRVTVAPIVVCRMISCETSQVYLLQSQNWALRFPSVNFYYYFHSSETSSCLNAIF